MIGRISDSYPTALNNTIPDNAYHAVNVGRSDDVNVGAVIVKNTGETTEKKAGHRSSPAECETCKHRKYQDGSDENVSFKSAAHIDPNQAGSRVRAHEQEHVSNAFSKASQKNGKVLSAVVSLHTAVCPECGRTYVSGGTTTTKIKYYGDDNAYHKNIDAANNATFGGSNVDAKA